MSFDRIPVSGEIVTAPDTIRTASQSLPAGHASLAELTALLNAAVAYERARRPIILTGPETHPAPAHVPYGYPARAPGGPGHSGIDVDLTGHGSSFTPPAYVAPLPSVPESRSFAPLAFLITGTAFIGSAFVTAATGGNVVAILATLGLLAGTGAAYSRIHGNGVTR